MHDDAIRLVDRKAGAHVGSLNLHGLAVDNLARRNGRVEYDAHLLARVEDDRL